METIDIPCKMRSAEFTSLKEKAAMQSSDLTWKAIADIVKRLAGYWGGCFNHLRAEELNASFSFTKEKRIEHMQAIESLIDFGSTLLLIIHQVEDDSNPSEDLTILNDSMTSALRSLTISRSAFSQPIEIIEHSAFDGQ